MSHIQRGFSIIELMVAVALIAVLAAIAIPTYNGYIQESHFTTIRTTINGMRTAIEDYRLENGNYGSNTTLTGLPNIGGRFDWTPSGDLGGYTYTVVVTGTNSYDVHGVYSSDTSIWARCDNRFQRCCDSDTTGSASITTCP